MDQCIFLFQIHPFHVSKFLATSGDDSYIYSIILSIFFFQYVHSSNTSTSFRMTNNIQNLNFMAEKPIHVSANHSFPLFVCMYPTHSGRPSIRVLHVNERLKDRSTLSLSTLSIYSGHHRGNGVESFLRSTCKSDVSLVTDCQKEQLTFLYLRWNVSRSCISPW